MHLSHLAAALGFLALEASALPKINLDLELPSLPFNPLKLLEPTVPGDLADSHLPCCSALQKVGQQFPIVAIAFCSKVAKQPPPPPPAYTTTTTAAEDPYATTSATKHHTHTRAYTTITTTPTTKPTKTCDDDDTPTSTAAYTSTKPTYTPLPSWDLVPPPLDGPVPPKGDGPILPRFVAPTIPFTPPGDQSAVPPQLPYDTLDECMHIDLVAACHCLTMAVYQPAGQPELDGILPILP